MSVYFANKNNNKVEDNKNTNILTTLKKQIQDSKFSSSSIFNFEKTKSLSLHFSKKPSLLFFSILFPIYCLPVNGFSETLNNHVKNEDEKQVVLKNNFKSSISSSNTSLKIDKLKIVDIYDSYINDININQNYLSYFQSQEEWQNKIAFVDDFSSYKSRKNNQNQIKEQKDKNSENLEKSKSSISLLFNFNSKLKEYYLNLNDVSDKTQHGLKVFLSFLKNFNHQSFNKQSKNKNKDEHSVFLKSNFDILNLFNNKNVKLIDGKTFISPSKLPFEENKINYIDNVYSSEWFKQNQDVKIWNNSYALGHGLNEKTNYLDKIKNLKIKIKEQDNVFIFSIGNYHQLIHSDIYQLNQKVKLNIKNLQDIPAQNDNLKDEIKKKTNVFHQLLNQDKDETLEQKKNFNTIFVAGFDSKKDNIWGEYSKKGKVDRKTNLSSKNASLDFSGYCLNAYQNCVLADVNFNNKEKGTSFSAPQVSFYFVLLKEIYPFLTNNQIGELILKSAKNIDPSLPVPNQIYGYGLIDLEKALRLPFYSSEINNEAEEAKNIKDLKDLKILCNKEHCQNKIRIDFNSLKNKNGLNSTNLKSIKNIEDFRIVSFSNSLNGVIILDDLNKVNQQVIVNFHAKKQKKTKITNGKLHIGKNNIVIVQDRMKIDNNGILIVDKKYDLKLIKNNKNGQIIQLDLNNLLLGELKEKLKILNF